MSKPSSSNASAKSAPLLAFNKPAKKPVTAPRQRVVVLPEEVIDIVFYWLKEICTPPEEAPWYQFKVMDFVWSCHWSHPIKCFGNSCLSFRLRVQNLLWQSKLSIVDTRNVDSASHLWVGLRCVDYHLLDKVKEFRYSNHGMMVMQDGDRIQDTLDTLDIETDGVRPNCMRLREDGTVDVDENTPLVQMTNTDECNKQLGHISVESDAVAMLRFIFARLISCHTFTWSTQMNMNARIKGVTLAESVAALPNLKHLRINQSFPGGTFDLRVLANFYHLEELYLDIDGYTPPSQVKLLTLFLREAKDLRRLTTTLHSIFKEADNVVLACAIEVIPLEPSDETRQRWALGKAVAALRAMLLSLSSKRNPQRVEEAEIKRLHALPLFKPIRAHLEHEATTMRIVKAFNESMERDEAERELARAVEELQLD